METFDGTTYEAEHDEGRLMSQIARVFWLMRDGKPRTLEEIQTITGGELTSISARLRDLRKSKYGGFIVKRQPRGERRHGLFEYTLLVRKEEGEPVQLGMFT